MGFPGGSGVNNLLANSGDIKDAGSIPGPGRAPGRGHGNPLQYFCPREPPGQRSLTGYSPWGRKELDMTETIAHTHAYIT